MKTKDLEALVCGRITDIIKSTVKRGGSFYGQEFIPVNHNALVLHKSASKDERTVEFQKRCDDMLLTSIIMGKPVQSLNIYKGYRSWMDADGQSELMKTMTTSGVGTGAEWIPTDFSRQLIELFELERTVAKIFPVQIMPTDPFKMPGQTSRPTVYKGTEGSAPTATSLGTTNISLDAKKLITYVPVSYELEEDSIIAILPAVKDALVKALMYAEEDCILNGDTTAVHMDADVTAADDHRTCWKGLRKHAIEQSYVSDLSTFNYDNIAKLYAKMGKYGANPKNCYWILGTNVRTQLIYVRDSQDNAVFTTLDKAGNQWASNINGATGVMCGSAVLTSEAARENLNATGVVDTTTATKAGILLVHAPGWVVGKRGSIIAEQDKIVKQQTIDLVASMREDFQPKYAIASNTIVWMGYNIAII